MKSSAQKIVNYFRKLAKTGEGKHGFFALVTTISILTIGYWFGTNDQVVHIPVLAKLIQPGLFKGDAFFDLAKYHYSFFWYLFIPFYQWGILEPVLFLTHIGATYMTFWMIWELAYLLFKDYRVSMLTVIILALPHFGFGGFPFIEFNIVNRTVVLPFLLFALMDFFKKKYLRAFLLLGILYNFHALSVNFVLAMCGMCFFLDWSTISVKVKIQSAAAFVLGALPVLIWRLGSSPLDLSVHKEWFNTINLGMLHNLYAYASTIPYIWILSISGTGLMILYIFARFKSPRIDQDRKLMYCFIGLVTIIGIGFIAYQLFPVTLLVQFQIVRASIFLQVFGYMYGAYYLVTSFKNHTYTRLDTILLSLILVVSPSIVLFLIAIALYRIKTLVIVKRALSVVLTLIFLLLVLNAVSMYKVWQPGIHIYPVQDAWYDVQLWARDNTTQDTTFITPPYAWGLYTLGWHVVSQRPTVVSMQEIMEMSFAPEHNSSFDLRFDDVAPGARMQFNGDVFHSQNIIRQAYNRLSEKQIYILATKYHARFMIMERPIVKNLPIVYQNMQYAIYDIAHPL